MKALFVGLGHAGQRHAAILNRLYPDVELYALRSHLGKRPVPDQIPILELDGSWEVVESVRPDVAFICNPTHLHIATATKCAERGMHLFIEKPVCSDTVGLPRLADIVATQNLTAYVGYPLHFHPLIDAIRLFVGNNKVAHVEMVCASDLRTWRTGLASHYYSAHEQMGGGALLDVSHELYLAQYLFGAVHWLNGTRGRVSDITVDTDDFADIIVKHMSGVTTTIHLNLFSRRPERTIKIRLKSGEWRIFQTNPWPAEMDEAFERQMRHFMENLGNPMLDGSLASCIPLFRQMIDLRDRTKI